MTVGENVIVDVLRGVAEELLDVRRDLLVAAEAEESKPRWAVRPSQDARRLELCLACLRAAIDRVERVGKSWG